MAGTDVDVANLALRHLRQRTISTFDDQSIEAKTVRGVYQQAVDGTLRAFDWPFARTYINAVPTVPNVSLPGWRYSFEYPADCLAIRELARAHQLDQTKRYRIASIAGTPRIFANEPAIAIMYTARPASPIVWDAEFTLSLSYHLAMLLAMPLTGKPEIMDTMRKLAVGSISQAEADAGNEDTNDVGEDPVPDWLSARGVPSQLRESRAAGGYGFGGGVQAAGAFILPGTQLPNPQPPMVTTMADQIQAAYIPGLTAPVPPPEPILGNSDFDVYVDGGAEGSVPEPTQ